MLKTYKLDEQEEYCLRPFLRVHIQRLILWIYNHRKLPTVIYLDLTKKKQKELENVAKEKGFDSTDDYVKQQLFGGIK